MNFMKSFYIRFMALILLSCWLPVASAQDETVCGCPDPNLRAKVREALDLAAGTALTQQAMRDLTELHAARSWTQPNPEGSQIVYLTGLEHATHLRKLDLTWNRIVDIGPLANLTDLRELDLATNHIIDVRPLAGLKKLERLTLSSNRIRDLTPLVGLEALTFLSATSNLIGDIGPLANLTQLTELWLSRNENIIDVSPLASLTHLETLHLATAKIADVSALSMLTRLRFLELYENQIVDVRPLRNLTQLVYLRLELNKIVDVRPAFWLDAARSVNTPWQSNPRCVPPHDFARSLLLKPRVESDSGYGTAAPAPKFEEVRYPCRRGRGCGVDARRCA